MNEQIIRDNHRQIIGYIQPQNDGSTVIRDSHRQIRGYYDPRQDITRDATRQIVGYGNLLTSLLPPSAPSTSSRPAASVTPAPPPTRSTTSPSSHGTGGLNEKQVFILAAIAIGALVAFSPGILLVSAARIQLGTTWQTDQMWAFAIASAAAVWLCLYAIGRDFRLTNRRYAFISVFAAALALLCHFGFHTQFTQQIWQFYFPQR